MCSNKLNPQQLGKEVLHMSQFTDEEIEVWLD